MIRHQLVARGIRDARVIAAMAETPRHELVSPTVRDFAYADRRLPIGWGQTVSTPLVVATLLEALQLCGTERVLDVGTGSGYQAALLGRLTREVWSIEIISALADQARAALQRLGAANVEVAEGDGGLGWPPAAPYDAIVVAAACPAPPAALIDQLAPGGRLVVPIGRGGFQVLMRIEKRADGTTRNDVLGGCTFAPMLGVCGGG